MYSYWVKCGMWAKSERIPGGDFFLCSVFLCSLKHLNQISLSSPPFLLYLFGQDFIRHLQWDYFYFIIRLTATEKSASFYLILLDLSVGFPLLLIFEQRKEIQNERSPFLLWLTLTSEISDCNGALPYSPLLISHHIETTYHSWRLGIILFYFF